MVAPDSRLKPRIFIGIIKKNTRTAFIIQLFGLKDHYKLYVYIYFYTYTEFRDFEGVVILLSWFYF